MRIAVGADHAGFELKEKLLAFVRESGHEAIDLGTHSTDSVDYPDYAKAVGLAVREGVRRPRAAAVRQRRRRLGGDQ